MSTGLLIFTLLLEKLTVYGALATRLLMKLDLVMSNLLVQ